MPRKKVVDLKLSQADEAILAVFVFDPRWQNSKRVYGLRAGQIVMSSQSAFKRLLGISSVKHVTMHTAMRCRRLVKLGYLRVASLRTVHNAGSGEYQMQFYAPTEIGLTYALSRFDHDVLPKVDHVSKTQQLISPAAFNEYVSVLSKMEKTNLCLNFSLG